ncbi:hypothetical protein AAEY27_00510 [Kosakonia sp. BYX6]|uniref:Tox-PLDMTX domain-containing protein n=1 Tax=Kosakonia calanthes TaxID=3139408 RepID=A0ABZ3B6C5_9ENTR
MSLYEMLPQKLPQPESSPESGDVSHDDAWLDPFSALAEEALELYGEVSPAGQQSAADAGTPGDGIPLNIRDESALQAFIRQAFAKKLPQIAEFREKGYNLSGPDEGAMKTLQAALAQVDKQPETAVLTAPAKIFLAALGTLPVNDPAMPPVLQDTVLQANRLVRLLTTALEALAAGAKVRGLDWAEEAKKTARQQREKLAEALAQEGLSPQAQKAQRLQAEGLMFSETYRLSAEYKKFSQLQDSLLAESRIVRHRLTQYLEGGTVKVEEGARDIREFALSTLLAQSDAKPSGTPEQLAVWGARLQQYARHLPGRDADVDRTLLAGNPLAAALSSVLKQPGAAEPPHVRLARAMLPVTTALGQATVLLAQVQQQVALPEEESRKLTVKPDIPLLKQVREAGRGVLAGSATLARRTGHRVSRGALRTGHLFLHQVLRRATDPDGLDRAVRNTGLLLLDEIQQAERQIKQLATRAWLLQEALEQQWRVQATSASLAPTLPELAALLDERLAQEASRWQQTGQQALTQLEALLAPFARLTESGFYTRLSEELQQAKALSEQQRWGDIGRMAEMMSGVADELAGVARGLDSAVIRLSEHGHAGGRELDIQLRNQTRKLEQLKAQVKTRIIRITGTSLDSFSRGGMLARGIAEWAEALKQDYLAGIPAEQRAQAAEQFDRALKGVMEENREQFARGGDPQAEGFLKRLALALQHAATGTQVYPPTAEEILAGSRSVPEDIRRWAERKVLGGALWAALRGGFNLVTGPVSLPLRVAIRGARTGYTLAGGLRKMNRVRLGEAPARGIKSAFIGQALAKIGIRLALSLSPGVGWGVAVTITAWEAGKNRHDNGALKKMVKRFALNIPEEGLWAGGYAGGRAAIISVIRARAEQELQDAIDKMVAEAQARAAALSDAGDFDMESYLLSMLADNNDDGTVTTGMKEEVEESAVQEEAALPEVMVEEAVEGNVQPANVTLQTKRDNGPAISSKPRAHSQQRTAALKRPGIKSFAGGTTTGISLASGTQTAPAEEAETDLAEEPEVKQENMPHRRGKRAAEAGAQKGTDIAVVPEGKAEEAARSHYPAPNRETAIDPKLELRVLELFPIVNGYRLPVSEATLFSARYKYYHYHGGNFLYIGGRYRVLNYIKINEDGSCEAKLYPHWKKESEVNQPLKVLFDLKDEKWHLAEDSLSGSSSNAPGPETKTTVTQCSKEITEAAKNWPTEKAYKYLDMLPGKEGQIYDDSERKYIFLNDHYWPVIFSSAGKFIIPGVDNGKDVNIYLQGREWHLAATENALAIASPEQFESPAVSAVTQVSAPSGIGGNKGLLLPLPMKTSISAALERKVSELFAGVESYQEKVTDLTLLIPMMYLYHAISDSYIYVGGNYYCVTALSLGADGDINGIIHSSSDIQAPGTKSISITFKNSDQQWHLREGEDDDGSASSNEKQIFTTLSPSVKTALSSIKSDRGFSYNNMDIGTEGNIYANGESRYIFLMGQYWPVRIYGNQVDITIKTADKKEDVIIRLYRENNVLYFTSGRATGNTLIQASLSSAVISELKKADTSSQLIQTDIKAYVEGFVYSHGRNNFILINNMLYDFQWISKDFAAIKFTIAGTDTLVFIKKVQQQWEFLEKTSSENYASFDDTLRRIKRIDLDPDIHKKLQNVLSENEFTSWQGVLRNLLDIVDEEIFKRYSNPHDSYLKNLLVIKNSVLSWVKSDESKTSPLTPERDWNEPLLALYKTALTQGTPTPYILTLAQNAKVLIKNLEKKRELLKTDDLENRIKTQEQVVSNYNKKISNILTNINHGGTTFANHKRLEGEVKDYEKLLEGAQKRLDILRELKSTIINKKNEYSDEIKTLNEIYSVAFAGIDLAEETLKANLAEQGENKDKLLAAQATIIELALKQVVITSKARTAYTSAELDELKKINISKTLLIFKQITASTFTEVLEQLKDSDIEKPAIKYSYADIVWANNQGEKIAQKLFGNNVDAELKNMLSAICYWLLKHKKKTSDLKGEDVENVIEEYSTDVQKFNPLVQEKSMPEGYTPLSSMISSNYFELQSEFNKQFSDYKEKFSIYDASERTKELLLISGLSVEEVLQPVNKRVRLKVQLFDNFGNPEIGEMLFIQLPDSRWVFFSIFPGAVTCKIFTNAEMLKNDYLRVIATLDPTSGGDGTHEVYDMDFFSKKYNFNPKKKNDYKGSNIRWDDVNAELIYGALYTEEIIRGESVPEFTKTGSVYTLSFNTRDNTATSDTVISVLNTSMRSVLNQSADALKSELYTPSVLQQIAFTLVPFYKEIYHAATDKDYQPDVASIMLDIVGVVGVATQAGVRVATIVKNTPTLGKIMQQGVRSGLSGQALKIYAIKELAKESAFSALKILKTGALATIDLVDPVAARSISKFAVNRISKPEEFRKLFSARSLSGSGQALNNKHARNNISIENMQTQTVQGSTVHSSVITAGQGPYYIKVDGNVYEVRWDEAFKTWRTVDPDKPDVLSYGVPVKQENNNWVARNVGNAAPKVEDAEASKTMMPAGLAPENAVRAAARRSRYTESTVKESGDYAAQLLEDAKLLSSEAATKLKEGLKLALANPSKEAGELFSASRVIDSEEKLLRVKQGEILIFSEVDSAAPDKITRRVHVMVSLGNGRFAGIKNTALGATLSDSKSILTAEQLGEFKNNVFKRRGDDSLPALQIVAGDPKDLLRAEYPTLISLAEQLSGLADDTDLAAKTTGLLKQAGELAPEQVTALQETLTTLLKASKGGTTVAGTAESLFVSTVRVTERAALQVIDKGKLVVFGNTSSPSFAVHHLMYSLGDGNFMMINPHLLDKRLVSQNGIINASQFPDDLFTKYGVLSGDISLSRLRTASLLGRDATFFVDGPILTVRLHGAPGIANFMDAYELAEVIKGLGLRESPPLKLGAIREIKLESCFGAFGYLPTGKALAHILDKKVTAYPLKFSQATRDTRNIVTRAKVYMPSDISSADLVKDMAQQQARNHDFWNRLLGIYVAFKGKRVRREASLFNDLLKNVSELASGEVDAAAFLEKMPEYKNGLTAETKYLEEICKGEVSNAETFAERCMDIITLSTWSANLLDKYLGGEGN